MAALDEVRAMPESQLPTRTLRGDGPPHPRTWADREPVADRRFKAAREATLALAEEHGLPVENLISPDHVRRAMWAPPATRDPEQLAHDLAEQLASYGARPWQVGLVRDALVAAVLHGDEPVPDPEPETDPGGRPGDRLGPSGASFGWPGTTAWACPTGSAWPSGWSWASGWSSASGWRSRTTPTPGRPPPTPGPGPRARPRRSAR